MTSLKQAEFKVFDPRRGEDVLIFGRDGETISANRKNLVVLHYMPYRTSRPFESEDFEALMRSSMRGVGDLGFFSVSRASDEFKVARERLGGQTQELYGSLMGYFPLTDTTIDQYLGLRRTTSYETFVIGTCTEQLDPLHGTQKWLGKTYIWDIDYFYGQIQKIACVARFDGETGGVQVVTRLFANIDHSLRAFGNRRRESRDDRRY